MNSEESLMWRSGLNDPEPDERDPERDYLAEAYAIVCGQSRLLPERAHLEAMYHEIAAERRLPEPEPESQPYRKIAKSVGLPEERKRA